jgi:hypothetical protein
VGSDTTIHIWTSPRRYAQRQVQPHFSHAHTFISEKIMCQAVGRLGFLIPDWNEKYEHSWNNEERFEKNYERKKLLIVLKYPIVGRKCWVLKNLKNEYSNTHVHRIFYVRKEMKKGEMFPLEERFYCIGYYPSLEYLATGATFEKRSEKPLVPLLVNEKKI